MARSLQKIQVASAFYTQRRCDSATNSSVSVGATSTLVTAADEDRIELILVNDSDEAIYISYGAAAVLNKGIRLNDYGGTLAERDFTGAVYAICASGSKNLTLCVK